jgi:hypothetical protein
MFAMEKLKEFLSRSGAIELCVLAAYPSRDETLSVGFEAYDRTNKQALTVIARVDPATLGFEVIAEIEGFSLAYATDGDWHGIVQRDGIAEVHGTTVSRTPIKLDEEGVSYVGGGRGRLFSITRDARSTLVCGTKPVRNYVIDGFVGRVIDAKLEFVLETSRTGIATTLKQNEGDIDSVIVLQSGNLVAGGSAVLGEQAPYRQSLFRGREGSFELVPLDFGGEICSLGEGRDGSLLVGCRKGAGVLDADGSTTALSGVDSGEYVRSVVEFGGDSYWLIESFESITVAKRSANRLAKLARAKLQSVTYRQTDFQAPKCFMAGDDKRLVVSNRERLHLFDGARWTQLALQRDAKKPVKRLPAGMK